MIFETKQKVNTKLIDGKHWSLGTTVRKDENKLRLYIKCNITVNTEWLCSYITLPVSTERLIKCLRIVYRVMLLYFANFPRDSHCRIKKKKKNNIRETMCMKIKDKCGLVLVCLLKEARTLLEKNDAHDIKFIANW